MATYIYKPINYGDNDGGGYRIARIEEDGNIRNVGDTPNFGKTFEPTDKDGKFGVLGVSFGGHFNVVGGQLQFKFEEDGKEVILNKKNLKVKDFFPFINEWGNNFAFVVDQDNNTYIFEVNEDGFNLIGKLKYIPPTDGKIHITFQTFTNMVALNINDGKTQHSVLIATKLTDDYERQQKLYEILEQFDEQGLEDVQPHQVAKVGGIWQHTIQEFKGSILHLEFTNVLMDYDRVSHSDILAVVDTPNLGKQFLEFKDDGVKLSSGNTTLQLDWYNPEPVNKQNVKHSNLYAYSNRLILRYKGKKSLELYDIRENENGTIDAPKKGEVIIPANNYRYLLELRKNEYEEEELEGYLIDGIEGEIYGTITDYDNVEKITKLEKPRIFGFNEGVSQAVVGGINQNKLEFHITNFDDGNIYNLNPFWDTPNLKETHIEFWHNFFREGFNEYSFITSLVQISEGNFQTIPIFLKDKKVILFNTKVGSFMLERPTYAMGYLPYNFVKKSVKVGGMNAQLPYFIEHTPNVGITEFTPLGGNFLGFHNNKNGYVFKLENGELKEVGDKLC